ncbi:protein TNT [Microtus pennsylvanicus]|uniref:protein TNT n=1 Tax=Microtus pennsylvanicus TaxID=10058 RepID=UPI003F6B4503
MTAFMRADRPPATFRGLQGPLLDKPISLPPAIKVEKGGSSVWNTQEQRPSPSLPSLELQPHVGSSHAATIQKPLRTVYSTLDTPHSLESLKKSTQHLKSETCSISTLSSSGYTADEESSKASLVNSKRKVKLTKRLTTQVDSTQSSDLLLTSSPRALKIRRRNSRGQGTQQVSSILLSSTSSRTSSKANSSLSIGVDCSEQGKPRSNNNLPEDKAKDTVESGSQSTQAEEPTQKPRPL